MTSGNISSWKKEIGDEINPGDVLAEIETDKAQMDFECQEEGFLAKILVSGGTKDVAVNSLIAIIANSKEDVGAFESFKAEEAKAAAPKAAAPTPAPAPAAPAAAPAATPAASTSTSTAGDRVFITPAARALAARMNIDITSVKGSGPNGRVLKEDVASFQPCTSFCFSSFWGAILTVENSLFLRCSTRQECCTSIRGQCHQSTCFRDGVL